jgi:glycosyltransferase involved in cell wall biosynthesis
MIISYGGPENFLMSLAGRRTNIKKIRVRARAHENDVTTNLMRKRAVCWGVDALVVPSQIYQSYFSSFCTIPVHMVTLGIDLSRYQFEATLRDGQFRRPTLTILGRLDPVKGHQKFFAVYKKLLEGWENHLPRPLLKVVGEPANISVEELMRSAAELGLKIDEDISFVSWKVDAAALKTILVQSDVGVISSLDSEIICRVGEEFLVAGVPVFVSGAGSLRELLFSSLAGSCYVDMTNEQVVLHLKNLLLQAYQEENSRRAQRSRLATQLYSFQAMGRSLTGLYERLETPV